MENTKYSKEWEKISPETELWKESQGNNENTRKLVWVVSITQKIYILAGTQTVEPRDILYMLQKYFFGLHTMEFSKI